MARFVFRNSLWITLIPSDNGMMFFISDDMMSIPRQLGSMKTIFNEIDAYLTVWRRSVLSEIEKKDIRRWLVQNGVTLF